MFGLRLQSRAAGELFVRRTIGSGVHFSVCSRTPRSPRIYRGHPGRCRPPRRQRSPGPGRMPACSPATALLAGIRSSSARASSGQPGGRLCPVLPARNATADSFIAGGAIGYDGQLASGLVAAPPRTSRVTRVWDYDRGEGRVPAQGGFYPASASPIRAAAGQSHDRSAAGSASPSTGPSSTPLAASPSDRSPDRQQPDLRQDVQAHRALRWLGPATSASRATRSAPGSSRRFHPASPRSRPRACITISAAARSSRHPRLSRTGRATPAGTRTATDGVLTRVGLNYRFGDGLSDLPPDRVGRAGQLGLRGRAALLLQLRRPALYPRQPFRPGQVNSRSIYDGSGAHAGESFAQIEHVPTGLFAKGFLGAGGVTAGRLSDEDFPPHSAYSKTLSPIKDGDVSYGVVDFGYNVLRRDGFRLGGFLGYQYDAELLNGYGCQQVAGGILAAARRIRPR